MAINRRTFTQGALATLATSNILTTTASAQSHNYGIVGQSAPELVLPYWIDGEGNETTFSLAAQRGNFVFMKCWQAWCPGCHSRGFPTLQKVTRAFENQPKVQTIAVQTTFEGFGSNAQDKVREMQLRYDLPIIMGHDDGQLYPHDRPSIMTNYRTGGTPWLVLIAPDGSVMFNDYHVNTERLIDYLQEQVEKLV